MTRSDAVAKGAQSRSKERDERGNEKESLLIVDAVSCLCVERILEPVECKRTQET